MKALLLRLSDGDRRSIGRANDVAVAVLADPGRLDELFAGLPHGDLWFPKIRTAGLENRPASRGHPLIVAMQSTDILKFDYRAQIAAAKPAIELRSK